MVDAADEWSEEEDKIIIDNYPHFKDLPNRLELLRRLLNNKRDLAQIKERIDALHISNGQPQAMENFNQLHNKKREIDSTKIKEHIASIKSSIPLAIEFIKSQLSKYIEFLKFKEAYMGNESYTDGFAIVPIKQEEFDLFQNEQFKDLCKYMNIDEPKQGQCFSRIPTYLTAEDTAKMIALFE
jgi:hypothetical protein